MDEDDETAAASAGDSPAHKEEGDVRPPYYHPPDGMVVFNAVALFGAEWFQAALAFAGVGDRVCLIHEVGAPWSDHAIAVDDRYDLTLGYLAQNHDLHAAFLDQGSGYRAHVERVFRESGKIKATLGLRLESSPV